MSPGQMYRQRAGGGRCTDGSINCEFTNSVTPPILTAHRGEQMQSEVTGSHLRFERLSRVHNTGTSVGRSRIVQGRIAEGSEKARSTEAFL